jgi:cytochrome c oxidase subunit II
MGKIFAVTIVIVAILSAIPIVINDWGPPVDVSIHGPAIDRQMRDTMWEAGLLFLLAQFLLALFVWQSTQRRKNHRAANFPGGATALIVFALLLGVIELLVLGGNGQNAWASVFLASPNKNALTIQAQAGQFAFYFRYPGPDNRFGPLHPDKIDDANQNFFGLDPETDADSRDDIVTAELAIPVNREINLLMHSKDVGHSFYVRELRIQQDFVPGLDLAIHFTATKPGRYEILCTQLCGLGHYNMKAYLTVLTQTDFDNWLKDKAAQ